MDAITEILKYTLPLIIVGGSVLLVIRMFFQQEWNKTAGLQIAETARTTLPLRLQACERIILFLERSEPLHLVSRLLNPQAPARELHRDCIASVREEFEHNFTQQLYISNKAWEAVKVAKESVVHLINKTYGELPAKADAGELARRILQLENTEATRNIGIAISEVKKEIQELF
jgi:hypothetical protein